MSAPLGGRHPAYLAEDAQRLIGARPELYAGILGAPSPGQIVRDEKRRMFRQFYSWDAGTWAFANKPTFLGANKVADGSTAAVKTKKGKEEKFNTIGVRFPESPGKEYTYKVRIGAKPYLGQELIADTPRGQAVVFVTRIDKTPKDTDRVFETSNGSYVSLKYIDRKAVAL